MTLRDLILSGALSVPDAVFEPEDRLPVLRGLCEALGGADTLPAPAPVADGEAVLRGGPFPLPADLAWTEWPGEPDGPFLAAGCLFRRHAVSEVAGRHAAAEEIIRMALERELPFLRADARGLGVEPPEAALRALAWWGCLGMVSESGSVALLQGWLSVGGELEPPVRWLYDLTLFTSYEAGRVTGPVALCDLAVTEDGRLLHGIDGPLLGPRVYEWGGRELTADELQPLAAEVVRRLVTPALAALLG